MYVIFRTLGLRHIVVTDIRNRVVGMVTRKDLMAFNMSEKLSKLHEMSMEDYIDDVRHVVGLIQLLNNSHPIYLRVATDSS